MQIYFSGGHSTIKSKYFLLGQISGKWERIEYSEPVIIRWYGTWKITNWTKERKPPISGVISEMAVVVVLEIRIIYIKKMMGVLH